MAHIDTLRRALTQANFLRYQGAYVVVDGQFGSTGKGVLSGVLAEAFYEEVNFVTSNAGPNSGHTVYHDGDKIVLRQLPTFSVVANRILKKTDSIHSPVTYLNSGAIIDPDILNQEVNDHNIDIALSPYAAIVDEGAKHLEANLVSSIGSTGKGTGGALARKVLRDPKAVVAGNDEKIGLRSAITEMRLANVKEAKILVEVSQGFSLGINQGFYPYTTSRQCTVAQALSDAGLHPAQYRDSAMVVRTYPIRVAGNSGPSYPDQTEVSWEELGQTPELTTVTQKVRRVFTWSRVQFSEAVAENRPSVIFLNFCNYLDDAPMRLREIIRSIHEDYHRVMGKELPCLLLGFGPTSDDVVVYGGEGSW